MTSPPSGGLQLAFPATSGYRISPVYDISSVGPYADLKITWAANTPVGTVLTIETNLSFDAGATWRGWQACVNGNQVPGVTDQMNLSKARIQFRQTLSTTLSNSVSFVAPSQYVVAGQTPVLHAITLACTFSKLQILVNGVDRTSIIDTKTLSPADSIGERSTASFVLNDLDNSLALNEGLPVEIHNGGDPVFAGQIDRPTQSKPPGNAPQRQYQLDCVDWQGVADRRIVAESYENVTAGSIVDDIMAKYLRAEGIRGGFSNFTFLRNSVAYDENGVEVAVNTPRFRSGKIGQAVLFEQPNLNAPAVARNRLTVNQADVETDLTGFTAQSGATLTRVTNTAWRGLASLQVVAPGLVAGEGFYAEKNVPTVEIGVAVNYCGNIRLTGTGTVKVYLKNMTNGAQSNPITVTLTGSWQRVDTEALLNVASNPTLRLVVETATAQAVTFYADGLQIANADFPVSWRLPGITVEDEHCTVDANKVLSYDQGGVEVLVYVSKTALAKNRNIPQLLTITIAGATVGKIGIYYDQAASSWKLVNWDVLPVVSIDVPDTLDEGYHLFQIRWTASSFSFFIDGIHRGTENGGLLSASGFGQLYLGWFNYDFEGRTIGVAYFDEIRLSLVAPSDEDFWQAWQDVQSGRGLQPTLGTSCLIRMDGDFTDLGSINRGPTVLQAVFNYVPASRALDALAELASCHWWIDAAKVIHFTERQFYQAPWVLDNPKYVNNLQVIGGRENYRNKQYVKAGKSMTDPQTERFKGDGSQQTFTVGFPIAKVPTVKVNTVTKAVGINGIDTAKDWYWNKGNPTITQEKTATVLLSTDILEVVYQGFFDIIATISDTAEIEARKAIEGGTGQYDVLDENPNLTTLNAAFEFANAKLKTYAKMAKQISFYTHKSGLRPGMILTANLPDRKLNNEEFLITNVGFQKLLGNNYTYTIQAASGANLGGWTKFFQRLSERGQTFVIRENISEQAMLVYFVAQAEAAKWAEASVTTVWACPIPGTSIYPSTTLYPC